MDLAAGVPLNPFAHLPGKVVSRGSSSKNSDGDADSFSIVYSSESFHVPVKSAADIPFLKSIWRQLGGKMAGAARQPVRAACSISGRKFPETSRTGISLTGGNLELKLHFLDIFLCPLRNPLRLSHVLYKALVGGYI